MKTQQCWLAMAVLCLTPMAAFAQEAAPRRSGPRSASEQAYGLASQTATTLLASSFLPSNSSSVYVILGSTGYVSGPGTMLAPVNLPSGALLETVEIEACDNANDASVFVDFNLCGSPSADCVLSADYSVTTGIADTLGCTYFSITPPEEDRITIDNKNHSYFFTIVTDGPTSLRLIRLFWRLQVSEPPLTATFPDVPLDSLQRPYIEALFASGIAGGCDLDNFCPDNPVTRGQLAVFLAKALGLHWSH